MLYIHYWAFIHFAIDFIHWVHTVFLKQQLILNEFVFYWKIACTMYANQILFSLPKDLRLFKIENSVKTHMCFFNRGAPFHLHEGAIDFAAQWRVGTWKRDRFCVWPIYGHFWSFLANYTAIPSKEVHGFAYCLACQTLGKSLSWNLDPFLWGPRGSRPLQNPPKRVKLGGPGVFLSVDSW